MVQTFACPAIEAGGRPGCDGRASAMNTPSSGLSDPDDLFGDTDPQVSVELDHDELGPTGHEDTEDRPLDTSARPAPASEDLFAPLPPAPPGVTPIRSLPTPPRASPSLAPRLLLALSNGCDRRHGARLARAVDDAIEASRNEGTTPERVLLAAGRDHRPTGSPARLPSATGSTTSTSMSSRSTWEQPTSSSTPPPSATRRCRSRSSTSAPCCWRWPTPPTSWRSTTWRS